MLKCLLVASYETPPRSFLKPQLGLLFLKKYAEARDCPVEIEIIDPQIYSSEAAKRKIEEEWDLIGFYSTYPTLLNSIDLMIHAFTWHQKNRHNRPMLLGGGPGSAFRDILDISPLDIVATGEAEQLFCQLIQQISTYGITAPVSAQAIEYLKRLPGNYRVRYRISDGITAVYEHTATRFDSLIGSEELDWLIQPSEWELELHGPYIEWTREMLNHEYGFPIYATRGCSRSGCLFCSSFRLVDSRGGTRAPQPHNVLKVFETVSNSPLRIRSFILEDDTFVWNREWMVQICEQVLYSKSSGELPPDTSFIIKSRVDQFDEELIRLMLNAGFVQINVGVESGSPNVLRELCKIRDPAGYLKRVSAVRRWIKDYGLRVHAYMIFFSPETSINDLLLTIELCVELLESGAEISTYETILALPGSPYEARWTLNHVPLVTQTIQNPMFQQGQHGAIDGCFKHPELGSLPINIAMPQYIPPTDPIVREVWELSRTAYRSNWESFKKQFNWRASTSARSGVVKLYTYLEGLKTMPLAINDKERVKKLADRANWVMGQLHLESLDLPESQSCTEEDFVAKGNLPTLRKEVIT